MVAFISNGHKAISIAASSLIRVAVGEEGTRYYLGDLSPRAGVAPPEVRPVARPAWLSRYGAARVATHDEPASQPLYPDVEGVGGRHVLERLRGVVFIEACRLGDYLRDLSSRSVGVGPEVWAVGSATWLALAAAGVAADDAPRSHPADIFVEGVVGFHVLEGLPAHRLVEAR